PSAPHGTPSTALCLLSLHDALPIFAGETERGTLPLLLAYPIARWEILLGKLLAHLAILTLAVLLGHGLAAGVAIWTDETSLAGLDRKSTRLNSSHVKTSYAVFCLKI